MSDEGVQPDLEQVQQEYGEFPAVPVRVTDPTQVNELPARTMHSRSITVTEDPDPGKIEILASEHLGRKWLFVTCTGQAVFIGPDKQGVRDGIAGILPTGVILPLPTGTPLYVRAATPGAAVVSYWAGYWAD